MKFIKKSLTFINFFFPGLILCGFSAFAQVPVPINLQADYPGLETGSLLNPILCSAYESRTGTLCLGTREHVYFFNGSSLPVIETRGYTCLDIDSSGSVYVGSPEDFCRYRRLSAGSYVCESFRSALPQGIFPLNEIFCQGNMTVLSTGGGIFIWNGKSILPVTGANQGEQLVKTCSGIYLRGNGYRRILPDGSVQEPSWSKALPGKDVFFVLESPAHVYAFARGKGLWVIGKANLEIRQVAFPDSLISSLSSGTCLNESLLLLGTVSSGAMMLDLHRNRVLFFSMRDGLLDNHIKRVYHDPAGFIYLVHDKGTTRFAIPDPLALNISGEINGTVTSMVTAGNRIYLAATDGIHMVQGDVLPVSGSLSTLRYTMSRIGDAPHRVFRFFLFGDAIFAIGPEGIFDITHHHTIHEIRAAGLVYSYQPRFDSSLLIVSSGNEWTIYRYERGIFRKSAGESNLKESVTDISETANGNFMLNGSRGGRSLLIPAKAGGYISRPVNTEKTEAGGSLVYSGKDLFLLSGDTFFVYDAVTNSFRRVACERTEDLQGAENCAPFCSDGKGMIWTVLHSNTQLFSNSLATAEYRRYRMRLRALPGMNVMQGGKYSCLTIDRAGQLYLAGHDQLLIFGSGSSQPVYPLGLQVVLSDFQGRRQYEIEGGNRVHSFSFPHRMNNLVLQVQSQYPQPRQAVYYSYRLKGVMEEFSPWRSRNEIHLESLPEGVHKLIIRAQTVNSMARAEVVIDIRIRMPFFVQWYMILAYLLLAFCAAVVYLRWRSYVFMQQKIKIEEIVSQRTEEIRNEKEKSEQLLANILPKDTADELKKKGKASSQKYDMVTVLFSDIQGFTKIAEQMNPDTLIDQLDNFYFHFDSVVERYNIEKIKTIGDAYMCAGGIPEKNRTNPVEVVLAALEVQDYMKELKKKNADIWDVRIGIHTGPVIAGVIGHKKFSYDIWGDTVNTASRMESSGEAGKINISGQTYEMVKDFFICEYRGKMPVKYKGEIDMYFVKGIRPELSVDLYKIPNRNFHVQLQKFRVIDLEENIFEIFSSESHEKLRFHNLRHTMEVYSQAELLGRAESLTEEDLLIVKTAALLIDIGYLKDYHSPEEKSALFAGSELPCYRYTESQVKQVEMLLRSSTAVNAGSSQLEKILMDAQTLYYGRVDFIPLCENLYQEELKYGLVQGKAEWIRSMAQKVNRHEYYTSTARKLREVSREEQVRQLENLV